jgi:hypothetical protein
MASYVSITNIGGILKLAGGSPKTLGLFRITCLDNIFDMHPSEEAALASFAKP